MFSINSKLIILLGIGIAFLGVVFCFFGDKLACLGRLPSDIRMEKEKENMEIYFLQ